jgi:hypothetical protein
MRVEKDSLRLDGALEKSRSLQYSWGEAEGRKGTGLEEDEG